ncbi:MAG TPA: MFS transporter [Terriglobia bacterium]|nr:MFS transporter [Terriglobia bacterium]
MIYSKEEVLNGSTKAAGAGQPPTNVRRIVLGLTVAAYMITYMDRVVMSAAVPSIQKEFGFSLITMGWIISSFRWAYAIFQIPGGWLGDRFGPRRTMSAIVVWWSVFTSLTTQAWSAVSMGAIRFLFGMGEAGAFPIATRSLSGWVLPAERGFVQGLTHAGSRLGAALTPPLVVFLLLRYGWRTPFILFGLLGLAWAAVWYWYYRDSPAEHKSVNAAERELLGSSAASPRRVIGRRVPWNTILSSPQMWTISAMYFCYAYSIDFYLSWFPKYLNAARGLSLEAMGLYASVPLIAGTAGDLLGGWISDIWLKRSGQITRSRRTVAIFGFLFAAACVWPAYQSPNAAASVLFSGLVMFGLEITVGVSWALTMDIGGEFAGSVSAVMNTCGNLGGALASALVAYFVEMFGWHMPFLTIGVLSVAGALLFLRIDAEKRIAFDVQTS